MIERCASRSPPAFVPQMSAISMMMTATVTLGLEPPITVADRQSLESASLRRPGHRRRAW
jgi:hypothetical protein